MRAPCRDRAANLSGPVRSGRPPLPTPNTTAFTAPSTALTLADAALASRYARRLVSSPTSGCFIGQRAIPSALERAGFQFHHNTIGEARSATPPPARLA